MSESKHRIYLSSPHMSGGEMKYINEAFDQNWVAPLGPNVDAFEKTLADYCGVKHAAALSSGTAAIHLALIILGVEQGDEVIASSFTFSATVNPIVYQAATPVFIDSEPGTWNMDPELLEKAIKDRIAKGSGFNKKTAGLQDRKTSRPKAIIPVHLYGMPANMKDILSIAEKYEIPVVEDAAEALGSKYNGKRAGSFGEFGILSFNGNKIITTSGGGALISDNKEFIDKARFLATQARDKAVHYQHSHIGYNYRMSNILAGIGRGQMEVIEDRVSRRREIYSFYKEILSQYDGIEFIDEPGEDYFSNRWLTTVLIDPKKTGFTREELQAKLETFNIETRPLWKPMHLQPVFAGCPAFVNNTSQKLFEKGLCLPSGSNMSEEDLSRIIKAIKACFNK